MVAPSRRLRAIVLGFAVLQLAAASAVLVAGSARVAGAPWCAGLFLLAALALLRRAARRAMTHRIDVSGTGALHLTVQQEVGGDLAPCCARAVSLLPASLVWPSLMLLHLAEAGGARHCVPVLSDSLAPHEFRALRVAIGTLIGRPGQAAATSEIL